jgi:hypothetical protein
MAQKAEHDYNRDFQDVYSRNDNQSWWIWGTLAALALGAFVVWFATTSGTPSSQSVIGSTTSEPATPPPAAEVPAVDPAQPAPAVPVAPAN